MIAIAGSGNNNLCHPMSYSYARSWRKTGSDLAVFRKIHAGSPYPTLLPQTGGRCPLPSGRINARPVPVPTLGGATNSCALLLFHYALQRVLVLTRKVHHLRDLGLGDLIGEHATLPDTVMVDVEHDLGGGFSILLKEPLKDVNDELHRSVVVVEDQNAIEVRALGLRLDLGDDRSRRTAGVPVAVFVVAHLGSGRRRDGRSVYGR